jgi:hypothetical protein
MDNVFKFVGLPLCWYGLGQLKTEDLRQGSFRQGRYISQKFKQFFWWDAFVEPFVITQFLRVFIIGNSFVEGLGSDNVDQDTIRGKLTELREEVRQEMNVTFSPPSPSASLLPLPSAGDTDSPLVGTVQYPLESEESMF